MPPPSRTKPGRLRIIGGEWRSRVIDFEGAQVRPTPDRVRQTLFDWLAPGIEGAVCLDLFAGSGALGLEALSRGAAKAIFVERDAVAASSIRAALDRLGAQARAEVVASDAETWLARAAPASVEVAFLDPPFASGMLGAILPALPRILRPENRLYLEWPAGSRGTLPEGYEWLKEKQAGQVSFGLATYRTADGEPR